MPLISVPLKKKYRNSNKTNITGRTKGVTDPEGGTFIWRAQRWKPNPGQAGNGRSGQFGAFTLSNGKKNKKRGLRLRPRRKAYGPW